MMSTWPNAPKYAVSASKNAVKWSVKLAMPASQTLMPGPDATIAEIETTTATARRAITTSGNELPARRVF